MGKNPKYEPNIIFDLYSLLEFKCLVSPVIALQTSTQNFTWYFQLDFFQTLKLILWVYFLKHLKKKIFQLEKPSHFVRIPKGIQLFSYSISAQRKRIFTKFSKYVGSNLRNHRAGFFIRHFQFQGNFRFLNFQRVKAEICTYCRQDMGLVPLLFL